MWEEVKEACVQQWLRGTGVSERVEHSPDRAGSSHAYSLCSTGAYIAGGQRPAFKCHSCVFELCLAHRAPVLVT
jgi:hypothetical protein